MGDAGAGGSHPADLVIGYEDAMGKPDIRPHPVHGFGQLNRAKTELLDAKRLLVHGLGQVSVHLQAVGTCQLGRFLHSVRCDRERRAGGDDDAGAGAGGRIVKGGYYPLGVGQDDVFGLND